MEKLRLICRTLVLGDISRRLFGRRVRRLGVLRVSVRLVSELHFLVKGERLNLF